MSVIAKSLVSHWSALLRDLGRGKKTNFPPEIGIFIVLYESGILSAIFLIVTSVSRNANVSSLRVSWSISGSLILHILQGRRG